MDSSSFVAAEIVLKRMIGCPAKLAVFVLSSAHKIIEIGAQDGVDLATLARFPD